MITTISIENLGPIPQIMADGLGKVNLIIGPNQSGKTFLLKALFAGMKTVEQYMRGKENRTDKEILSDKLYWTFQASELGSIVRKGESSMSFSMVSDKKEELTFSFGPSAKKLASIDKNTFTPRNSNTVFIPAKEILSIRDIILEAKDENQFGFEEPYSDLAKALSRTQKGKNYDAFSHAREIVSSMVGGRLEYNEDKKEWQFRDNDRKVYEVSSSVHDFPVPRCHLYVGRLGYTVLYIVTFLFRHKAPLHPGSSPGYQYSSSLIRQRYLHDEQPEGRDAAESHHRRVDSSLQRRNQFVIWSS